jgi:hypothetical protein
MIRVASSVQSAPSIGALAHLGTEWDHRLWFEPPAPMEMLSEVRDAMALVDNSGIEDHPFFAAAAKSKLFLKIWVSQELVVTGPFSQLLLDLASRIDNVHIRAKVSRVAAAEHGPIRNGVAYHAHPWLLYALGKSVGLQPADMVILPETSKFLDRIRSECASSVLAAAGVLGMGSERLLVPEYTAARTAFDTGWPECNYRRFLDANIEEDSRHAALMEEVGNSLLGIGHHAGDFLRGARVGIEVRLDYYTELLRSCEISAG